MKAPALVVYSQLVVNSFPSFDGRKSPSEPESEEKILFQRNRIWTNFTVVTQDKK